MDAVLRACINAVDGGTYAPSGLITVGGSGMQLTGPLVVARGGTLNSQHGILAFDPLNFPLLSAGHPGRTRTILYPFVASRPVPYAMWRVQRGSSGIQSLAPGFTSWQLPGTAQTSGLSLPIRAIHYATISSVTVTFAVVTPHTTLPQIMPAFRMLLVDQYGNASPCTSVAAGADTNGFMYVPKPSNVDAWRNGGYAQSFTFACDQNNFVTRDGYSYRLEALDEQGLTGYPWQVSLLQPCRFMMSLTNISGQFPLTGLLTSDGITASDGDRVLVNGTYGYGETGIYIARSGSWVRAQDVFTQGAIVGIQEGINFGGTYWQAGTAVSNWTPGTTPPAAFWHSGTGYTLNKPIIPRTPSGFWYVCTTAGTSASTEPGWPTATGQTVTDGGVVWTCAGPASTPLPFVTRPDVDLWSPELAMNGYGTVFHSAAVQFTNIYQNRWQ